MVYTSLSSIPCCSPVELYGIQRSGFQRPDTPGEAPTTMQLPETQVPYSPQIKPRGNPDAKILVVGEAPGANEIEAGVPFVGASGQELMKMLAEAGISESDCRFTNVINIRPDQNNINNFFATSKKESAKIGTIQHSGRYALPIIFEGIKELREEIIRVKPNVVISLGNTALWACIGHIGIMKWRGSELTGEINGHKFKLIPMVHPAAILRNWDWRWFTVVDLRRAARESSSPTYAPLNHNFIVRPSFLSVRDVLSRLLLKVHSESVRLAVDIETRDRHIACIGLAWSKVDAICIPLMDDTNPEGYWSVEEECEIWWRLYRLLTHKNCLVIGQNFMYDNQYFVRRAGFACNLVDDTMMKMHVCFPGVPKALDFIASIWCERYTFWKEESKDWDPHVGEDQLWIYNCKDAISTFEINIELDKLLDSFGLRHLYDERMRTAESAFKMMLRGFLVDKVFKAKLSMDCMEAIIQRRDFLIDVIGFDVFGPKGVSPKKMKILCYDLFQLPPKYRLNAQKKRRLTCDKDAIDEWLATCNIFYRPVLQMIKDVRSLGVFKGTFADAGIDWDGRFRCSFKVAGPHTFRWASAEDAFGFGGNMQTIPKGDER